jgi:hypothetical protein
MEKTMAEQEEGTFVDDQAYDESYLDLNLDEAVDLVAVEPDEYRLVIYDARVGRKTPESQAYLLVRFDIPDVTNAKDVTHVMMLPDPQKEDAKQVNKRKLQIREMMDACGIDWTGQIDLNALKGAECWAILGVEESEEYGEQNRIRRFVTGS